MYFTIKIFIYFLLLQSHTFFHELGHVIAIHISKRILIRCKSKFKTKIKMPTDLETKIRFIGNGRTESRLYEYIASIKCRPLISFNAISGILIESIFYFFIVIVLSYLYKKSNYLLYSDMMILFTELSLRTVVSSICPCLNKSNDDIKYFKHPEKYKYKYDNNFKIISLNDFKDLFISPITCIYIILLYISKYFLYAQLPIALLCLCICGFFTVFWITIVIKRIRKITYKCNNREI